MTCSGPQAPGFLRPTAKLLPESTDPLFGNHLRKESSFLGTTKASSSGMTEAGTWEMHHLTFAALPKRIVQGLGWGAQQGTGPGLGCAAGYRAWGKVGRVLPTPVLPQALQGPGRVACECPRQPQELRNPSLAQGRCSEEPLTRGEFTCGAPEVLARKEGKGQLETALRKPRGRIYSPPAQTS